MSVLAGNLWHQDLNYPAYAVLNIENHLKNMLFFQYTFGTAM